MAGVVANVTVKAETTLKVLCIRPQLLFVVHELLKNAMAAHNRAYGIDADLGPEVRPAA
jgi:hypothetical protein